MLANLNSRARRPSRSKLRGHQTGDGSAAPDATLGLWTLGAYGASPDGLVFDGESHGLLEVKTSFAKRKKSHHGPFTKCPRRFFAQIQGQLAVVDREWQRGTTGVVFCPNRALDFAEHRSCRSW